MTVRHLWKELIVFTLCYGRYQTCECFGGLISWEMSVGSILAVTYFLQLTLCLLTYLEQSDPPRAFCPNYNVKESHEDAVCIATCLYLLSDRSEFASMQPIWTTPFLVNGVLNGILPHRHGLYARKSNIISFLDIIAFKGEKGTP